MQAGVDRAAKALDDRGMIDVSRSWPFGLDGRRWWVAAGAMLLLLGLTFAIDRPVSLAAQALPASVRGLMATVTTYGESGWILYPAAILYLVTALVALLTRWKLMRTMLWQFASLYAFIFLAVGLPSLVTTLVKRLIGRGRPMHFGDSGLFGLHPNWLDWTYQSFPSGHSTTALALGAAIVFLSPRWFYPALVYACAIVASRVILGVHYPSDVYAGAVVGLLGAYAVRWAFARRGWAFRLTPDDHNIVARPMLSVRRYLQLKRRGNGPARSPGRT